VADSLRRGRGFAFEGDFRGFKLLPERGETSSKPYCLALILTNALLVGRLVSGRA
jgi:hypothetical protein